VLVLLEATGSYDRPLRQALTAAAIGFARVNPARARDFARATGMLAKHALGRPCGPTRGTDRTDARMLAAMAQALAPAAAGKGDPEREALALAHRRRDQLVHHRQQERTRRTECRDAALRADIAAHLDWLDARITHWDAEISHLLRRCERLDRIARLLRRVPGIAPWPPPP
jgi:transposase